MNLSENLRQCIAAARKVEANSTLNAESLALARNTLVASLNVMDALATAMSSSQRIDQVGLKLAVVAWGEAVRDAIEVPDGRVAYREGD